MFAKENQFKIGKKTKQRPHKKDISKYGNPETEDNNFPAIQGLIQHILQPAIYNQVTDTGLSTESHTTQIPYNSANPSSSLIKSSFSSSN
jgi:hypothetical protein